MIDTLIKTARNMKIPFRVKEYSSPNSKISEIISLIDRVMNEEPVNVIMVILP
jgi:hypothetical protein